MPKNIAEKINKYLIHLLFQKIKANKNGNPVCPEKNKSAQKFIFPRMPALYTAILSGNGQRCVRVIKIERIMTKTATDFKIYGICAGYLMHRNKVNNANKGNPMANSMSTS